MLAQFSLCYSRLLVVDELHAEVLSAYSWQSCRALPIRLASG